MAHLLVIDDTLVNLKLTPCMPEQARHTAYQPGRHRNARWRPSGAQR